MQLADDPSLIELYILAFGFPLNVLLLDVIVFLYMIVDWKIVYILR